MKRSVIIAGCAIALLVVLGTAAYIAPSVINGVGQGSGGLPGGPTTIRAIPAKELPPAQPDSRGVVLRRVDNSLYIGTNVAKWQRIRDNDAAPVRHEITFNGPVIEKEVVVTHDTVIYRDATSLDQSKAVDGKVQQVLAAGTLEDIRADAMLQVWGVSEGDRVVARVLVYSFLPA